MRYAFPFVLFALACGGAPAAERTSTPPASNPNDEAMLAGNRAALTLIVRPGRWSDMTTALTAVTETAVPAEATSQPIESLLRELWQPLARGLPDGLDPERPVLFRLGESDEGNALSAVANALAAGEAPPPLRHVFVFPAISVMAMRADLERRIAGSCSGTPPECGELGHPHLLSDASHVFVVFSNEAPVSVATLLAEPGAAFRWALQGDAAIAGHLRASAVREAGTLQGANAIERALRHVDDPYVDSLRTMGMSEVVGLYVGASPYGRELSDVVFAVETSPLRVRLAARLTHAGLARFGAQAGTTEPLEAAGLEPIVVRSAFDLRAVVAASERPFGFRTLEYSQEISEAYQSGGMAMHVAALLSPIAFLRLFAGSSAMEPISALVRVQADSGLPPGAIDVDVDVGRLIQSGPLMLFSDLARVMPYVYLRSKLDGSAWTGVIALDGNTPVPDASFEPALPDHTDAASLECLERFGSMIAQGLGAFANVSDENRAELAEMLRRDVETNAGCVRDPSLAAEVQAYRDAAQLVAR